MQAPLLKAFTVLSMPILTVGHSAYRGLVIVSVVVDGAEVRPTSGSPCEATV